jgi:phosphate transport system substrate-binding protein
MRKFSLKSLSLAICLIFAVSSLLAACGTSGNGSNTSSASGSITVVGSTALQPLAEKAAQQFMSENSNAQVQVQGGGSGTGLTQVLQGGSNIGDSDVYAAEKLNSSDASALVDHKVAVVGFAAVVNPNVKVDNLTQQQLIDIFTGKITNWKDIGGNNTKIVVINRPGSSGTRATFKKYALKGAEEVQGKALTEDSSGTVKKTVADTDGAIAYLALSYLGDNSVKALKFEGVEATAENIVTGKYPIWSYEHMYTKGEALGLTKSFIDYMMSDKVQKSLVPSLKFIPISDMKVSR